LKTANNRGIGILKEVKSMSNVISLPIVIDVKSKENTQ
jgi:hypothetical protein